MIEYVQTHFEWQSEMIDRDDMLELTRRMTLTRNCFDRIAGAYVDETGEVEDTFNILLHRPMCS